MKSIDKESLIHKCLTENYKKYYRIAYSYTFQEQDAMDIVQEGAYRAILKSNSLRNPEYADTWICRIMMNEAVRFLNKNRGRTIAMEEIPETGEAAEYIPDKTEELNLKQALCKLNEKDRRIVILRFFEEETLRTIAEIMNLNENTVTSRLYRAMEKLKKYMGTGGAEHGKMETGI